MISIVLPVYNVEKYIENCINSLLNQTNRDFEIIVVNDGTKDGSAKIAAKLLENADISYSIINTENRGVSAARNTGVKKSTGEYVIMVDADDTLSPSFVADFARMAHDNRDSDIFSCSFYVFAEQDCREYVGHTGTPERIERNRAQELFLDRKIRFLLPALMFRKSFLENNGLKCDEDVRYSEDVQFIWMCLSKNNHDLVYNPTENYHYILHQGSTMTASGIKKILTGCSGIEKMYAEYHQGFCKRAEQEIMCKWYFGMLHGASKMLDYAAFSELYSVSDSKRHIADIRKFGNMKSKAVLAVLFAQERLGYLLLRKF